jgi:uncharacterized protein (UPF0262 family)
MSDPSPADDANNRIVAVTLDEASIGRSGPDIEHERAVAIYDLIVTGDRLVFDIRRADGTPVVAHLLSLNPFRRIVKDYFMICDSYYQAIRTATPERIRRSTWAGGASMTTARAR